MKAQFYTKNHIVHPITPRSHHRFIVRGVVSETVSIQEEVPLNPLDPEVSDSLRPLIEGDLPLHVIHEFKKMAHGNKEWQYSIFNDGMTNINHGTTHDVEFDYYLGDTLAGVHYHPSVYMTLSQRKTEFLNQVLPSRIDLEHAWVNAMFNKRRSDWKTYTEFIVGRLGVGTYTFHAPKSDAECEEIYRRIHKLPTYLMRDDTSYVDLINYLLEKGYMKMYLIKYDEPNTKIVATRLATDALNTEFQELVSPKVLKVQK